MLTRPALAVACRRSDAEWQWFKRRTCRSKRMTRFIGAVGGLAPLAVLWACGIAAAGEPHDVVLSFPFGPGERPRMAQFYYDGRAIGEGRDAFAEIVERMRSLPEGTSIVWGPDYRRCG